MKKIAASTILLLSIAEFCCANPIGKVPPEKKNYSFPKPVENVKVQPKPSKRAKNPEKLLAYEERSRENPPLAQQQNDTTPSCALQPIKKPPRSIKTFTIDVAPQYSYVMIRSRKMRKLTGHLYGGSAEMEYKKSNHVYGDVNFLWNQGKIRAHGRGHEWKEAVAEFLLGYTTPIFHRTVMTIFAGFGYRRVMDHKSYQGFHHHKQLIYDEYFVPCGLLFDFNWWDHFGFSLDLKAMPAVDEKVQFGGKPDVFYQLSRMMNYEVDLPITWKVVRGIKGDFDLSLIPFYKYWQFGGNSRIDLRSRTQTYWGGALQIAISF